MFCLRAGIQRVYQKSLKRTIEWCNKNRFSANKKLISRLGLQLFSVIRTINSSLRQRKSKKILVTANSNQESKWNNVNNLTKTAVARRSGGPSGRSTWAKLLGHHKQRNLAKAASNRSFIMPGTQKSINFTTQISSARKKASVERRLAIALADKWLLLRISWFQLNYEKCIEFRRKKGNHLRI